MVTGRWSLVGSSLLIVLSAVLLRAQETQKLPAAIFGTWVWNAQRQKIDSKLEIYRCYVEVLEDLGGGKVRMRDYRIRQNGQVVKNDANIEFGRISERAGIKNLWAMVGPLSYQLGPADRDTSKGFIVTREIIEGGKVMRHIGEGLLNGMKIRNEQYFDKVDGPAQSGECAVQ